MRKPDEYRNKLDDIIFEAKQFMKQNGLDTLPSSNGLHKLGYDSLRNGINHYAGGFNTFRKTIDGDPSVYWKRLDSLIDEAQQCMKENGLDTLPSRLKLDDLGYESLSNGIIRYGGFEMFRNTLEGLKDNGH